MRDAFYLLIFSYATDALMDTLGLDSEIREASGHSLFTLELHLNYLHEVKLGAEVEVHTQLIAHDAKRLHLYHSLHLVGEERESYAQHLVDPILSDHLSIAIDMGHRNFGSECSA